MDNDILVSILCETYNHENYIAAAIEGFLSQKTSFKYEILIHDDASTDKTAQIIREYELKYRDVIKPIYQKENKYSQGINVSEINAQRAIGKYYALCEGDDYWTDPFKLQKQVDILEKNPNYSLCTHAAIKINALTDEEISKIEPSNISRKFNTEEIIIGGGGLFATNSMVFRRIDRVMLPDFYKKAPFKDYPLTVFLSLIGEVYYIDDIMSVYRYGVPNSWSVRTGSDEKKQAELFQKILIMLDEMNNYTNNAYQSIIEKIRIKEQFQLLILQGNINEAKTDKFIEYYSSLSLKSKMLIYLKKYCPYIYRLLKRVKRLLLDAKKI